MLPLPFVLPIIPEERSQLTLPPEQRSALRSPSAAATTTTAAAAPLSASPYQPPPDQISSLCASYVNVSPLPVCLRRVKRT